MALRKYSPETVITEADMLLSGMKLSDISQALDIPMSTVSWHLIYPLRYINFDKWARVRKLINKFAKNKSRAHSDYLLAKSKGYNFKEETV